MAYVVTKERHDSCCRMADLKLKILNAFYSNVNDGLTFAEAISVFSEITQDLAERMRRDELNEKLTGSTKEIRS